MRIINKWYKYMLPSNVVLSSRSKQFEIINAHKTAIIREINLKILNVWALYDGYLLETLDKYMTEIIKKEIRNPVL